MMADLMNLNKARKAKDKAAAKSRATRNRVAFGRTKGEKAKAAHEAEAATRTLEGAKRDDPGQSALTRSVLPKSSPT